jgi:hypothetical protein
MRENSATVSSLQKMASLDPLAQLASGDSNVGRRHREYRAGL